LEAIATTNRHSLGRTIAQEIREAFNAYTGKKWEQTKDGEKAVWFTIESATLAGCSSRTLDLHGRGNYDDFHSLLLRVRMDPPRHHIAILHGVAFQLACVGGTYTGEVTVRDGSSAWDYEL